MEKILIIDDNEYLRYTLTELLHDNGFDSYALKDGFNVIDELRASSYGLIILDMKLPGMDGFEILKKIRQNGIVIPVIMLTAFGDIKSAVESIKHGAQDYITKPFDNDDMVITIKKNLEIKYLSQEVNLLRKKIEKTYLSEEVIGKSDAMKKIFEQVKKVAPTNLTVLLEGESGTGKEVIANMIHRMSDRADKSFIAVDCGAIPETLIESELFGHEKGAFTDAKSPKEGKFEQANGGTIFLDEITNLSDQNQMKLLRVIQEKKVTKLGSNKSINLNVRIITATNLRLVDEVSSSNFRQDLFYRLNEFHIELPPLKERKEDIPLFIDFFINDANKELNKNVEKISDPVMERIKNHTWPGNARELRNVIRRAVLLAEGNIITSIDIPGLTNNFSKSEKVNSFPTLSDSTKNFERDLIIKALNETGGNKSKAAKILNMNERTLYRRIKSFGIE